MCQGLVLRVMAGLLVIVIGEEYGLRYHCLVITVSRPSCDPDL